MTYLAADDVKGRVNFTKEQLQVAEFLHNEFTDYCLQTFPGSRNFYLPFQVPPANFKREVLRWNGKKVKDHLFFFFPHHLYTPDRRLKDFKLIEVRPPLKDSLVYHHWKNTDSNLLIRVVLPDSTSFSAATKNLLLPAGIPSSDIVIVAAKNTPEKIKLTGGKEKLSSVLYNVVGVLPGRSLPQELIIFSAHYDHVDRGIDGRTGEIFNGANDDASGTTAVLALAKYFSARKDNERTLIFCLFAGEELGLLGSRAFVNQVASENCKAVINIEMIGNTNAAGKNAFMVIGANYSNLAEILAKNLENEKTKLIRQTYDPASLFRRSDNFPFAEKGIPAHSIMCSDDTDPCYHRPCDDVKNIDIENMTKVIQAIAKSCTSLINGTDTPERIKN